MTTHELSSLEARCRCEFLDMPGLRLTARQAARLFGVDPKACKALLEALVESGFLRHAGDTYLRAGTGRYAA
jgi:DNA-binding IclR family transcriptional regulator